MNQGEATMKKSPTVTLWIEGDKRGTWEKEWTGSLLEWARANPEEWEEYAAGIERQRVVIMGGGAAPYFALTNGEHPDAAMRAESQSADYWASGHYAVRPDGSTEVIA
jgi:hypothetical protein